ncbi:hypothetical protein TCAL_00888 [Tigriopus californicus]|uniref:Filamin n=2 Tax=Tigriopus californicus TaxID=6832 RepID=A0A553NDT7_TIGCA|nr:hypothetical protein TCAL_00888 [Tigriopus californicus]
MIEVEYLPEEVGPHIIKISQDSIPVEGSPFTCNVYDVANILVAGLTKQCHMGRPCTFTVDASKAGEGTLELVVTTAKTSVRAEVQARSRGLYDVTFVPQELNPHFINITFNDEHIEQSPFECSILEQDYTSNANENGQLSVIRGRSAAIELSIDRAVRVVALLDPHGNESQFETAQGTHGKTRILLKPSYVGKYTLETQPSGQGRDKILINVFDPSKIQVMKTGPAFVGEGSDFIVDTSNAGRGALSVNVKAAGQDIKHSIKDVGSGRFEVTFFPYLPIPHKIDVKFNGVSVARSLLEIKVKDPYQGKTVTASGMGLFAAKVNDDTSFIIDTMGYKSNDFDILVTGPPDGVPPFEAIPLRCYQQKDGKLLAEFCTTTVGAHKIEVLLSGQHIRGSPFECQSFDPETVLILDVEGKEQHQLTGQPISFKLDRRRSGLSDLDVVVTSPVGDDLPIEIKGLHHEPGVDLVEFKPEMAGKYRFIIQYGGTEIPNSPLTFNVRDTDAPVDFRAFGQGLQKGQVNHPCYFEIEQFNDDSLPRVDILHPSSGQPLKTNVEKTSPTSMRITYVPDAIGSYLILVQHEGRAPLEYKANVCNPKRIQIIKGFDVRQAEFSPRLALQQEVLVLFHLNEAGVGKLEAELILPNHVKAKVDVHHVKERAEIRFLPQEYGEYALAVKFNGILLPFCPMRGLLDGGEASKGSGKVKLTGTGLVSAICQEDNFFMIDGSRAAQGTPDVKLTDATNLPLAVRLRKVDADVYEARYSPSTPGDYMLSIKWAGHLIKGCPLNITASPGSASEQPASKVFCSGEGLRGGTLGKDIRSFIDTRKAGPGELSLHCVGPRGKTAYCELNDHQDGTFTLNLKPQEAGRHQLAIKYGGNHVKGSPFTVRVSGSPDPDKVKVYGPGIDHGVLAMYQSRFICDTRGAGAGQLTVRIRGPKGAFRVEMQRESQKDRTILCKYEPTEPGDYRIEVKWSGENVPGSPFVVMIFDTQEELSRFLQRGYSPTGYSSDMYGTAPYSGSQNYGVVPWAGGQ